MKPSDSSVCIVISVAALAIVLAFGPISLPMVLVSFGAAAIFYSIYTSLFFSTIAGVVALFTMVLLMKFGLIRREGFHVFTSPNDIAYNVRKMKEGFKDPKEEEEFKNKDDEEEFRDKRDDEEEFRDKRDDEEEFRDKRDDEEDFEDLDKDKKEGFISQVFQNISRAGYNSPGFGMAGPLVEGFEDEKKAEKKGKPAPVVKKEEMAMPFKLGEIPSQVKNGPHIDAGSTLVKAIQSLNPEQINAMTKDTKQLIETQKSLMGMLGTMKPMMNDGKELMDTFQQMFGQDQK